VHAEMPMTVTSSQSSGKALYVQYLFMPLQLLIFTFVDYQISLKGPKKHVRGIRFSHYDTMKANVPWWLQTRSPHFFSMQTECHVLLEQIYQLI
jgi:hypothetical protein